MPSRNENKSRRPGQSPQDLIEALGALGVTAGREDAREGIGDARRALMLEQGAPLPQASRGTVRKRASLEEDDDGLSLAFQIDSHEDTLEGPGCQGGGEDAGGEEKASRGPIPMSPPFLLHSRQSNHRGMKCTRSKFGIKHDTVVQEAR